MPNVDASKNFKNLQVIIFAMRDDRLAMFETVKNAEDQEEEFDDFNRFQDPTQFVEPVDYFDHSRRQPLICLICDEQMMLRHLAKGNRGDGAGTGLAQIKLSHKQTLTKPFPSREIYDALEKRFRNRAIMAFMAGGIIPLKTSHAVLETLLKLCPESKTTIEKSLKVLHNPLLDLTEDERFAFQQQKDAVLLSLELAGLDRKQKLQFNYRTTALPKSYLDGLSESRLREDAMIYNDLSHFPGFQQIKRYVQNAIQFSDHKTRLTVLLVNRHPLETLIGTDLIYYNETFNSFVMVQYKAMEKEGNDPVFRIPNEGLDREVANMLGFFEELRTIPADKANTPKGFRLNHNPFFLKFCPRVINEPDDVDLVPGMYLPLNYWTRLSAGSHLEGKNGGKALRYDNADRYITNSDFTNFVSKAWIGTHVEHSSIIEQLIRRTLETGKSVTMAHVRQSPPAGER
jgi:hypothetical protein